MSIGIDIATSELSHINRYILIYEYSVRNPLTRYASENQCRKQEQIRRYSACRVGVKLLSIRGHGTGTLITWVNIRCCTNHCSNETQQLTWFWPRDWSRLSLSNGNEQHSLTGAVGCFDKFPVALGWDKDPKVMQIGKSS